MKKTAFIVAGLAGLIVVAGIAWHHAGRETKVAAAPVQPRKAEALVAKEYAERKAAHQDDKLVRSVVWQLTKPTESTAPVKANFDRFHYLAAIKGALSAEEVDELCRFLEEVPRVTDMNEQLLAALNNEILNSLARQSGSGARVQSALLKVQADPQQTPVMRDYAIQHLGLRYLDGYPDRDASRKAFWDRADDFETTGATAMLALHRIAGQGLLREAEQQQLVKKAAEMAQRPGAAEPSRMVALQILRHNRSPEGVLAAKSILNSNSPTPLTIAAVATLGDLGGPEDATLLTALEADPRYAAVTATAKKHLTKPLSN